MVESENTKESLNGMIFEFAHLIHRTRRVGMLGIQRHELEDWFGSECSVHLTRFIAKGMGSVREGRLYERTVAYLRAQIPEEIRNSDVSVPDLKAMEYAIQLFEFCVSGDLESYNLYVNSIWADEFPGQEMLQEKQVLEFVRKTDWIGQAIDRPTFEAEKRKDYKHEPPPKGTFLEQWEINEMLGRKEKDWIRPW